MEVRIREKDCLLYALSLGLGRDPLDENDLPYVYERGLQVLPTMAVVLGHPGPWFDDPRLGITKEMLVHGTQRLRIHQPLAADRPMVATNQVVDVVDKGREVGGIVVVRRRLFDAASKALIAEGESGVFCRADGGFGGHAALAHEFSAVPARGADAELTLQTEPHQALYYRLNGDMNPLHADPAVARRAGFPRPILHGLCTFGMAGVALQKSGGALRSIEARFSKPVFPGERIRLEMWREEAGVAFRAWVDAREAIVLDRGRATFF
ncbi:MAG: MaoC family dehydratase N-terminal domain-containing protein [Variovorax sp.]|nr:MaoC family dehydratase N-terminal domain-containing protein [Variovorax sp.]